MEKIFEEGKEGVLGFIIIGFGMMGMKYGKIGEVIEEKLKN